MAVMSERVMSERKEEEISPSPFQASELGPLLKPMVSSPLSPYFRTSFTHVRSFVRPPFIMDLLSQAWQCVVNPHYTRYLAPLQLLGEVVLCSLIIWKIPCKDIPKIVRLKLVILTDIPKTPKSTGKPTCNKSKSTSPANATTPKSTVTPAHWSIRLHTCTSIELSTTSLPLGRTFALHRYCSSSSTSSLWRRSSRAIEKQEPRRTCWYCLV